MFEFGCGTGRLARRLLTTVVPEGCHYLGVDVSETMVALAREQLLPWAARACVVDSDDGRVPLQCEAGAYDRFVATYVLDLLDDDAIQTTIGDAHRLLAPDGWLCLVGLTHGRSPVTKLVSSAWAIPSPIEPESDRRVSPDRGPPSPHRRSLAHRPHSVVTAWGISSEVLVAVRRAP